MLQNGITIVIEGKTQKAIKGTERSVLLYELKGEDVYSPEINFRTVFISSDREKEQYRDKVNQLNRGDIAYFDDLPEDDSVVEIGAGQQVGRTGWFNGYLTLSNPDHITRPESSDQAISHSQVKKMCHWEIFSDEILLPDYDDGIISNEEFHTFYQDPRIRLPLSQYIIETYSEWSDQMDWKSAYDNAIGFHRNGQRVNTIDGAALYPIEKYIESFRTPHAWFENRMIEAMNPLSDNLFKQGKAVFYHPVRFLQWLIDRDWA